MNTAVEIGLILFIYETNRVTKSYFGASKPLYDNFGCIFVADSPAQLKIGMEIPGFFKDRYPILETYWVNWIVYRKV